MIITNILIYNPNENRIFLNRFCSKPIGFQLHRLKGSTDLNWM